MTTINDINDLARILREQPEWADTIRSLLLSQELLELPVRFAEFVELTNRNFQLVYERLERLETDMAVVKDKVSGLEADMAVVKDKVSGLEADMVVVKDKVSGLEIGVSSLRTDMNLVKGRLGNIEGKLDNALGSNYEMKVVKSIGAVVGSSFRRVRVQKGLSVSPTPEFMGMLEDAEDSGVITEEQYIEIQRSDVILTGRRKSDGADVYIAAEISITLSDSDITRAVQRAEILAAIVGQPSIPAVIGAYADGARTALAAANNVGVFLSPEEY